MRTLKYAILGLLCRGELTGYDIAKVFERGLGNFWSAGHSQIYPELKKLVKEGLVVFSTVIQGEKLEKKLYTMTQEGREDFQRWVVKNEPLEPTPKDAFKLRLYLCDAMSDEQAAYQISSQIVMRQEKLQLLETSMREEYDGGELELDRIQRGDFLVLKGAIMREKSYLEWLHYCLQFFTEVNNI